MTIKRISWHEYASDFGESIQGRETEYIERLRGRVQSQYPEAEIEITVHGGKTRGSPKIHAIGSIIGSATEAQEAEATVAYIRQDEWEAIVRESDWEDTP